MPHEHSNKIPWRSRSHRRRQSSHLKKASQASQTKRNSPYCLCRTKPLYLSYSRLKHRHLHLLLLIHIAFTKNMTLLWMKIQLSCFDIKSAEDVSAFVILTVHDPFETSTANFQAPIIVNVKNNHAKQVILNNENYKTKHPLFGQPVKG